MSNARRINDADLTTYLEAWLSEGPESVANRVPDAALRQIREGAPRRRRPRWPGWMSLAAAAVLLTATGIGAWRLADVVAQPSPTPSRSVSESPANGLVTYTSHDLAFEVGVPAELEERHLERLGQPCEGIAAFGYGKDQPYPALAVSIGGLDGTIQISTNGLCTTVTARTLDELDAAIQSAPASSFFSERTTETVLDGEPARYISTVSGHRWTTSPGFHHVLAFHDGRPVVIAFDHYLWRWNPEQLPISAILDSFQWLDRDAGLE